MGSSRTTALARRKRKRGLALGKAAAKRPLRGLARPSWKVVGLAGIAGVAATGVVVARKRREHREMAPDELRERLHSRLAAADAEAAAESGSPPA